MSAVVFGIFDVLLVHAFTDVPKALADNLPYIIVPILLTARMWRAHPFTRVNDTAN